MKTILVPTENIAAMRSALETALALAQRTGGYIEGFPLRLGLREFVTVELSGSFPVESYQEQSNQEMAEARRLFEGFMAERGVKRASGVETTRGAIRAKKIGIVVAGNSSRLAAMAGLRLPIESHIMQAFVSEGVKPLIDHVITFGAGHFYISQSDKGGLVFGGDIDGYNSYAQRGNLPTVEDVCEGGVALMPVIGRLRIVRSWGGLVDMSMDGSPIIDRTPIDGLYLNAAWNYGGFKATPGSGFCFAHLIARDEPHLAASAFRLDRYFKGDVIDERGAGPQPNLH